MPRGALTFRQRDVTAAMRGATAAGFAVTGVEVDKSGRIVVHTAQGQLKALREPAEAEEHNEWDEVLSDPAP